MKKYEGGKPFGTFYSVKITFNFFLKDYLSNASQWPRQFVSIFMKGGEVINDQLITSL